MYHTIPCVTFASYAHDTIGPEGVQIDKLTKTRQRNWELELEEGTRSVTVRNREHGTLNRSPERGIISVRKGWLEQIHDVPCPTGKALDILCFGQNYTYGLGNPRGATNGVGVELW